MLLIYIFFSRCLWYANIYIYIFTHAWTRYKLYVPRYTQNVHIKMSSVCVFRSKFVPSKSNQINLCSRIRNPLHHCIKDKPLCLLGWTSRVYIGLPPFPGKKCQMKKNTWDSRSLKVERSHEPASWEEGPS